MTLVEFTARSLVRGDPAAVFDVLTDWPRQTAWVPGTVVEHRGGPVGAAEERFGGFTALGPLRFDDPMTVLERRPPRDGRPGAVDIVKTGRVLGGRVGIGVRAVGGGLTAVEWTERILVHPRGLALLAALGGPVPGWCGKVAFEAVLRAARSDLESPPAGAGPRGGTR